MIPLVLLIEDDPKVASTVQLYLEQVPYRVVHYSDGAKALDWFVQNKPDLILLDLMLPGLDGLTFCRRIRRVSSVPIIMLTARTTDDDQLTGFDLGADDYVPKPFSPRQLMARVKAVMRRSRGLEADGQRHFDGVVIDHGQQMFLIGGQRVQLTSTQFAVLRALSAVPGRVYSRGELTERALGEEFDGSVRVIDAHIKNLRRQFAQIPHDRPIIETVTGAGYRFARKPLNP